MVLMLDIIFGLVLLCITIILTIESIYTSIIMIRSIRDMIDRRKRKRETEELIRYHNHKMKQKQCNF